MHRWGVFGKNGSSCAARIVANLCLLLVLAATAGAAETSPGEGPTPAPDTPTPTPTPISQELFQQKLSQWAYVNFARIGPIREATVRDMENDELWRAEEGDSIGGLLVVSIKSDGLTVRIGGREGTLDLVSDGGGLSIIEDDFGPYTWNMEDGPPNIVESPRFRGKAAFQSTGNNRLQIPRGSAPKVGMSPGSYSRINVAIYLIDGSADILIQAQGSKTGWTRWAFDAERAYRGGYPWPPAGTTTALATGRWHYFSIDVIKDLEIGEGEEITELAFSAYNKKTLFDSVSLSLAVPPGAKPVR